MIRLIALLATLLFAACSSSTGSTARDRQSSHDASGSWNHGSMVSAANPAAVEAAVEVLKNGGHAVDAAIAAHAVLGLVEPESSGIGGSAFMLVYDRATNKMTAYDGRETAPARVTAEMYLRDGEPMGFVDIWPAGISIGVPGTVSLYQSAHDHHGRLPWANLFDPAIALARDGFEVTVKFQGYLDRIASFVDLDDFPNTAEYLYPGGEPLAVGDLRTNPRYANTLLRIALEGSQAFYQGDIADAIARRVQAAPLGGSLTTADIAAYRTAKREPVCGAFRENTICSIPPPSSGIAHIMIAALYDEMLSDTHLSLYDKIGVFVDAQRLTYADRDHFVADPEFADVPVEEMIHPAYIERRATERFAPSDPPVHGNPGAVFRQSKGAWTWGDDTSMEMAGTSHLSIIDRDGNAVSMTASVGFPFGSLRMTNGFFLNNQMTDFAREPTADGEPVVNAIAPGKRPRSSMSPTIVLNKDGEPLMLTGSSGGSSILAYTMKTILAVLDWGHSAQEAVDFPNIVARGDAVSVERGDELGARIAADLVARGYDVREGRGENSGLHIIVVRPDGLEGAADKRRHGAVGAVPPR